MDPVSLVMIALIGVLIIFMFRNGKKRQQAMQEMQDGLRPGAEVMLQSGIFGTVESVDEEDRVTVLSGTSTLVVHRNAVGRIVTPSEAPEEVSAGLAPDDDPEFGERVSQDLPASDEAAIPESPAFDGTETPESPATDSTDDEIDGGSEPGDDQKPQR